MEASTLLECPACAAETDDDIDFLRRQVDSRIVEVPLRVHAPSERTDGH
jgi:hypothetical protein